MGSLPGKGTTWGWVSATRLRAFGLCLFEVPLSPGSLWTSVAVRAHPQTQSASCKLLGQVTYRPPLGWVAA